MNPTLILQHRCMGVTETSFDANNDRVNIRTLHGATRSPAANSAKRYLTFTITWGKLLLTCVHKFTVLYDVQ